MDFIYNIKEETLIICNKTVKENIISLNILKPLKFMSIKEFIRKYCFDYNENAILYLIEKYHYDYEIAKNYIENIYYIEDKLYNVKKLDHLVKIKKELI